MNALFDDIASIFLSAGIVNFEKLPTDHAERGQFAKLFKQFNNYLEAAKIQGFTWNKLSYDIKTDAGKITVALNLDETTYLILALRYKELFSGGGVGPGGDDVPYEIDSYLTEINTGVIDANYMKEISMEDIFKLIPLSRRSVEMRFKKATGVTIYQYLLNIRIRHFSYLLTTTDKPYIDLAYEVGFRDFANVTRTFRKYKGCTPLEYRKKRSSTAWH